MSHGGDKEPVRHRLSGFRIRQTSEHLLYVLLYDFNRYTFLIAIRKDAADEGDSGRQLEGRDRQDQLAFALSVRAAKESKRVAMVDLDPQRSLVAWWQRRGKSDNPTIFEGAETAADAVEALALDGWDWVFIGGRRFLTVIGDDQGGRLRADPSQAQHDRHPRHRDAVGMAREADATFAVVFNEVGRRERIVDKARDCC